MLFRSVCRPVGAASSSPEQTLGGVTPQTHPDLVAAVMDGYPWAPDEEFELGLTGLIGGWRP